MFIQGEKVSFGGLSEILMLGVFLCCRWLQPDSYADPQKTSLILNKDDIRCGWPTVITVQTKDQYGDVVHVPNMKVTTVISSVLMRRAVF